MSLTVFRLPLIMHATGLFRVPGDMRVVSELRKVVDKAGYFDTKLNTVAVYPPAGTSYQYRLSYGNNIGTI